MKQTSLFILFFMAAHRICY